MSEKETIVLYNRGQRSYNTSKGPLASNESLAVPADEARKLLVYGDLVDASQMAAAAPPAGDVLREENAGLKAKVKELEAAAAGAPNAGDLQAKLNEALSQVETLTAKVENLEEEKAVLEAELVEVKAAKEKTGKGKGSKE